MATDVSVYMLNYFKSLQALEAQQEVYRRAAKDEALAESDRAEAAAAFLDFTDQIAQLKDAHEAFMRQFVGPGVPPPSDAAIQRSTELARGLAQELAKTQTVVAIVGIVSKFVSAWGSLAGAGAAPAGAKSLAAKKVAAKKVAAKKVSAGQQKAPGVPATALNLFFLKSHK